MFQYSSNGVGACMGQESQPIQGSDVFCIGDYVSPSRCIIISVSRVLFQEESVPNSFIPCNCYTFFSLIYRHDVVPDCWQCLTNNDDGAGRTTYCGRVRLRCRHLSSSSGTSGTGSASSSSSEDNVSSFSSHGGVGGWRER